MGELGRRRWAPQARAATRRAGKFRRCMCDLRSTSRQRSGCGHQTREKGPPSWQAGRRAAAAGGDIRAIAKSPPPAAAMSLTNGPLP